MTWAFWRRHRPYSINMVNWQSGIEYQEGNRSLELPTAEIVREPTTLIIRLSDLDHWAAPYEHIRLTQEDKQRVMRNIEEHMRRWRVPVVWEDA